MLEERRLHTIRKPKGIRRHVSHHFDAEFLIAARLKLCNTIEMTLGRVLWVDLGMLFDSGDHREKRSLKLRKCQK